MSNYMQLVFNMINHCNTQLTNGNEYSIARAILNHVEKIDNMSLEVLANESNISQASVSRFIKKIGFKSYQDFRESLQKAVLELQLNRKFIHKDRFSKCTEVELVDQICQNSIDNIIETKQHIDIELIKHIVTLILKAPSVTFYGDDHALAIFYTLQLDLLANGVPSYLFKTKEAQSLHFEFLEEQSILLFFNVYEGFFSSEQKQYIQKAKQKKVVTVLFCQDDLKDKEEMFDYVITYGQPQSVNQGYYSLIALSQILSELCYHTSK